MPFTQMHGPHSKPPRSTGFSAPRLGESRSLEDFGILGIVSWGAGSWLWPGLCLRFVNSLFIEGIDDNSAMVQAYP